MNLLSTFLFTAYYFALMYVGFKIGRRSTHRAKLSRRSAKVQDFLLYGLLFFLAYRLGTDQEVVSGLATLGYQGALFAGATLILMFALGLALSKLLKVKNPL